MKKIISIVLFISLTSCSLFWWEKNNKNIVPNSGANIVSNSGANIASNSGANIASNSGANIIRREQIIELEKKKLIIEEINNIQFDNEYIYNLNNEFKNKYKSEKWDLSIILREFNNLYISLDDIIFLKWRCDYMKWGNKYYEGWKILKNKNIFSLKEEYFIWIDDLWIEWEELKEYIKELDILFSKNFSETHLKISESNSYKEVISLMWINKNNLKNSLNTYTLILILTNKDFDEKKHIINDIFKNINDDINIYESYLSWILYYYYYSKNECDSFFNYLVSEFNK
jgi:hypothetical protein